MEMLRVGRPSDGKDHTALRLVDGDHTLHTAKVQLCLLVLNYVHIYIILYVHTGFPGGSDGEESACSVGDPSSSPGLGRSPREGNDNPLPYSCLENPMDRGAWRLQSVGSQSDMTE